MCRVRFKHRITGLFLLVLMVAGVSHRAQPQASELLWMQVAKVRAVLKANSSEHLVQQFSYDDLKWVHRIGPPAMESIYMAHDLLRASKFTVEEIVKTSLRESKMKAEDRFRMKIILERVMGGIGLRGNNPPDPYLPEGNHPPDPD